MPADGLPPAGTPVPAGAPAPLTDVDAQRSAVAAGEPAQAGPVDDGAHPDGVGAVGLGAKIRAVLRVRDFRKLWLSMSLSSFGDWLGLLAITATAT